MRRFWSETSVAEQAGLFTILLDAKTLRLPNGHQLAVPQRGLAEAIATEWQVAALGGEIDATTLRLTSLTGQTQLVIAPDPQALTRALLARLRGDLLVYRADDPPELAALQQQAWQPWLDWAANDLAAPLRATHQLIAHDPDPATLASLERVLAGFDPWALAALDQLTRSLNSLILALAVLRAALSPQQAHELATLETRFQAEKWGVDPAITAREAEIAADIEAAALFFRLTRP
jgi:chaperone required for assembly of F1-ATPase